LRDYKHLLASFIQVVTFYLAAFGGFLRNVAPPDPVRASFPVGALSFLTLLLLMIISAMSRNRQSRRTNTSWLVAGAICFLIAAPSIFFYRDALGRYTYPQSRELNKRETAAPDKYLKPDAARYKSLNPSISVEELVRDFPPGEVWTQVGIEHTRTMLLVLYACVVLSIAAAVFCLLEANMLGGKSALPKGKVARTLNKPATKTL